MNGSILSAATMASMELDTTPWKVQAHPVIGSFELLGSCLSTIDIVLILCDCQ